MKEKDCVLLLTACVNPYNMVYTKLVDPEIRKKQYLDAVDYYYHNTKYRIVICNNTGDDFQGLFSYYSNERFEYIFFEGNKYDALLGKGYGEFEIIKYALSNSQLINKHDYIIKVTGRLIIPNVVKNISYTQRAISLSPNSVLARFERNTSVVHSECFAGPKAFFRLFISQENLINDSKHYYFEHLLYDTLLTGEFCYYSFLKPQKIIGVSGTHNSVYKNDYESFMNQYMDIYCFLLQHKNCKSVGYSSRKIKYYTYKIHTLIRIIKYIRKYILNRPLANEKEGW